MKVLIVVEDPTLDQYIAKPIIEHLFSDLGRKARVDVLTDPHLRGIDEALDSKILGDIVADNPMEELFILLVDRDCNRFKSEQRAADREKELSGKLIFGLAVQELEVWMLALHRAEVETGFSEVREHCDPKEAFAEPFLQKKGWSTELGRGRKRAMRAIGSQWNGLLTVCPELKDLRDKIKSVLAANPA
ncbi:hypothetical protein LZ198_35700 [Myxococcus sp. K15C18031901]|uniref:hypothetical protein n=1 Tax=Myxococcus dinghuensis TaxID=2906761 RepID=UPI0020A80127|nr:hypothetical protein [Myxococcus dinghuensis]MCP3104222.1 hypothetical protein [Myxococcus dinghuensis]